MANKIQIRRDSASSWIAVNPVLAEGEFGYETDTGNFKIGDGVTAWNSLANAAATVSYVDTAVAGLVDSAPDALNTLNELSTALGNDADFATTVTTSIGTKWTEDAAKITNWDEAHGWGDHSAAGYMSSLDDFVETTYALGSQSGSVDVDPDNGTLQTISTTGDITVNPVGWSDGQTVTLFVTTGGAHTLSLTGGLFAGASNSLEDTGVSIAVISRIAGNYYISINKGFATV
jgi:hypothetical protein